MRSPYIWPKAGRPLPGEKDFDPYGGCLDCQHAFQIFGGMSLEQAFAKFCELPYIYQEDFLFMGPKAFIYYFPVLDRYLREITSNDPHEDCEAIILAYVMTTQLDDVIVKGSARIIHEIRDLSDFVLKEVARFSGSKKIHKEISFAWAKVRSCV